MFATAASLACAIALALPAASQADVVLDWNEVGVAAVAAARQAPPDGARTMAMVHVAMVVALNAIEPRFRPYGTALQAPAGTSADAAAAKAAHAVLAKLFPEQRDVLDKAWQAALQRLADERGVEAGIALGERAAAECIALRARDGVGTANAYRPVTQAGVYVSTALPVSYDWREVKPWILQRTAQLRPEPPPALSSAIWARDYNEIKMLGGRDSAQRTPAQTETARFWAATGVGTWNPIVRALAQSRPRSLTDNARLFALVNMAASDAFAAVFDAKYAFNFWRPVTSIRNGDIDGNDATALDATWLPLIDTPMHPEYPCAHCISAAAVATVLEAEFGTGRVPSIAMTSPTAPGVTHRWERIADYVDEVKQARIWAGVHYRHSTEVGERMGRAIGRLAVDAVLQPLR
jgi:hypothetical protein